MNGFTKRLPRLTKLMVFESAARRLSFTASAIELKVTQSAVSQQVRALEQELGVTLFVRSNRGLILSGDGRDLNEIRDGTAVTVVVATAARGGRKREPPILIAILGQFGQSATSSQARSRSVLPVIVTSSMNTPASVAVPAESEELNRNSR